MDRGASRPGRRGGVVMDETPVGEKSLLEKVEAIRRRWQSDWINDDCVQYVFAPGDIRTLLKAIDLLREHDAHAGEGEVTER